jgi:hypothetical protein
VILGSEDIPFIKVGGKEKANSRFLEVGEFFNLQILDG